MEDMLAQVQASNNLLDALRALPRFPDIRRSACARLQRCLALQALTPAQLASVAQGVKQAGFLLKDEELLLNMVASTTSQSSPPLLLPATAAVLVCKTGRPCQLFSRRFIGSLQRPVGGGFHRPCRPSELGGPRPAELHAI